MLGFHHCRLIALQQFELISTLKRYLNALVIPSPKLPIDNVYDFRTEKAIKDFKMMINRRLGRKMMVEDGAINYGLWMSIPQELRRAQDRLPWAMPELNRIATEGALRPLQNLFSGLVNSAYTTEMRACDKKLAELFGGEGAVVMTIYEPEELKRKDGSSLLVAGKPRGQPHNAIPANELVGTYDRGGIIHIYMNEQGLPNKDGHHTSVYVPAGFKQIYEVKSGKQTVKLTLGINNTQYFYNKILKLYAVFAHVETSKVAGIGEKKANGSMKIGNIGGPEGGIINGEYIHVHIAFYSEFFGNHTTGTRVDPRDYFCK